MEQGASSLSGHRSNHPRPLLEGGKDAERAEDGGTENSGAEMEPALSEEALLLALRDTARQEETRLTAGVVMHISIHAFRSVSHDP
jgi:hypothetical protein